MKNEVLMRKWRHPDAAEEDEWKVVYQIVLPEVYRKEVISLADDSPMAELIGVNKTHSVILTHFYWASIRRDIAECGRSGHTCKVVGRSDKMFSRISPPTHTSFCRIFQ